MALPPGVIPIPPLEGAVRAALKQQRQMAARAGSASGKPAPQNILALALLRINQSIQQLSADQYNAALIANPTAFATIVPRSGSKLIAHDTSTELHQNRLNEPVMVYVRTYNATGVEQLLLTTQGIAQAAATEASVSAPSAAVGVLVYPNATLSARVLAAGGTGNSTIVWTVMPLRASSLLARSS